MLLIFFIIIITLLNFVYLNSKLYLNLTYKKVMKLIQLAFGIHIQESVYKFSLVIVVL